MSSIARKSDKILALVAHVSWTPSWLRVRCSERVQTAVLMHVDWHRGTTLDWCLDRLGSCRCAAIFWKGLERSERRGGVVQSEDGAFVVTHGLVLELLGLLLDLWLLVLRLLLLLEVLLGLELLLRYAGLLWGLQRLLHAVLLLWLLLLGLELLRLRLMECCLLWRELLCLLLPRVGAEVLLCMHLNWFCWLRL